MLLVAALLAGCVTKPTFSESSAAPDEQSIPLHLGRVQTQTQDGVTVQLVIPTDEQVAGHFGVPLAQHGIQPIWIRIDNASSTSYWILPISIDPDYFTADEAALLATEGMNAEDDARVTEIFRQSALPFFLKAGSVHEGYVYAIAPARRSLRRPEGDRARTRTDPDALRGDAPHRRLRLRELDTAAAL